MMKNFHADTKVLLAATTMNLLIAAVLLILVVQLKLELNKNGNTSGIGLNANGLNHQEGRNAIDEARTRIGQSDFTGAYDYLLAGMRASPNDPGVFDAAMAFTEAANGTEDEALADDIFARAEILVSYQDVKDISAARNRWNVLAETFYAFDNEPPNFDWLADIKFMTNALADSTEAATTQAAIAMTIRNEIASLKNQAALGQIAPVPSEFMPQITS
ncbi:MAG: hypothetical protein MK085_08965, partial [Phycisphaerales bacterium]|nr:hypothetical protein [Phycisphaerales bacterium]